MRRLVVLIGLAMALAIALPDTATATNLTEVNKLTASDAEAKDQLGISVAVSGDTAVAGVPFEDAFGANSGAAYVFQRNQGGADNWGDVTKLTASDAEFGSEFGDKFGISVAVSGDTIIVGTLVQDSFDLRRGAAYIFQRNQGGAGNWGEVKRITSSGSESHDWFGWSVGVSGDTAIVGARFEEAGAAYVFQRDQGGADNWGEVTKLTASDAQARDNFGISVAIGGDTAVVGINEDAGPIRAGAAYIFERDQGGADNWGEVSQITASDAGPGDDFGWSVAVSGNTVVVGMGHLAGAAYVFERNQGGADNWGEVTKLTASDAGRGGEFGRSVAVSGDTTVVGARSAVFGDGRSGAAYVFGRDQGGGENWGEVTKLVASDAQDRLFGYSVSVSGDTVVVGAPHDDEAADAAGAAYVFDLLVQKPTPTVTPTFTITPTPTPTPLPPVGGISLDTDAALRPLETAESSSRGFGVLTWAIAAGASAVALSSAAWWSRRRQSR